MAEDRYVKKLADHYAVPEDVQKANAESARRMNEALVSPSQEEVDEAVSGYPKRRAERSRATGKAAAKKDVVAEDPEATYRTRTAKPTSRG